MPPKRQRAVPSKSTKTVGRASLVRRKKPTPSEKHKLLASARTANASLSVTGEQHLPSPTVMDIQPLTVTPTPRLPDDILYPIIAYAIGHYFSHIVALPDPVRWTKSTVPSLLSTSRWVRNSTVTLLNYIFGSVSAEQSGIQPRLPSNFGQTMTCLCTMSAMVQRSPDAIVRDRRLSFADRLIRHPIHPFLHLCKIMFVNDAIIKYNKTWGGKTVYVTANEVFNVSDDDWKQLHAHFFTIPNYLRPLLLGDIWCAFTDRVMIWQRLHAIRLTIQRFNIAFSPLFFSTRELQTSTTQEQQGLKYKLQCYLYRAEREVVDLRSMLEHIHTITPLAFHNPPCLTASDLDDIAFFPALAMLDSVPLDQDGTSPLLSEIRSIGRQCLRVFLCESEAAHYMDPELVKHFPSYTARFSQTVR